MNGEYRAFFGADFPARATVVVPLVAADGLVEIMVTAVVPDSGPRWIRSLTIGRRLGISACLLGDEVRFDGGHKRDPFLTDILSPHVCWVRVCPEVEVGMGTPRETLRLERRGDGAIRMVTTRTGIDHTDAMSAWARRRLTELERDLCRLRAEEGLAELRDGAGQGLRRLGMPQRNGRGIFAEALLRRFPNLPVEEEGRLSDPGLRENFIERVFAYQRLRRFFAPRGPSAAWSRSTRRTR